MFENDISDKPIWWCISGDALVEMLRRCHDGEDPGLLYAEFYANSQREDDDDAS